MLLRVPVASALAVFASAAHARADVPPDPGRPEWHDAPLPQPEPLPEVAWLVFAGLLLAALAVSVVMRRREAG
ncbi:MAG TPA: LPXTG cell wall anchor domain-containing protein [Polyangiaceae bacterium LLY-WYZ-15_(1-7)]|nr:hypothetical protein [Myxococcales bacterium]MBJ75049.1 hypothetical protein [Sandaracinus sp.]HJL03197.1 LPXTG cell wall anchor domain-containing protein [Polyangiaceae bacterium LLY-WYZ-15_(1-7)]HJL11133.1 LPXTG cell wall anchor domain-containing protein [Polyangiaceae bacterium LLY-WYZ-15_(1-7)]HJL21665.1 LPXTG cell wall anchor domain-containing protein [Polyangiaceae bacterium LLY-WYZ-15_(1-7)]